MKALCLASILFLCTNIIANDIKFEIENQISDEPQGKVFNAIVKSDLPDGTVVTISLLYVKGKEDVFEIDKVVTKFLNKKAKAKLGYIKKRFYPGKYQITVTLSPVMQTESILNLIPDLKEKISFEKSFDVGTEEELDKMRKEVDESLLADYEKIKSIYKDATDKFEEFRKKSEFLPDKWKEVIKGYEESLGEINKNNINRWDLDFYWKEERGKYRIKSRLKDLQSLIEQFTEYLKAPQRDNTKLQELMEFSAYIKEAIEIDIDWLGFVKPINKEKITSVLHKINENFLSLFNELENVFEKEKIEEADFEKLSEFVSSKNSETIKIIIELGEDFPESMMREFKKIPTIAAEIESLLQKVKMSNPSEEKNRETLTKIRQDFKTNYENLKKYVEK